MQKLAISHVAARWSPQGYAALFLSEEPHPSAPHVIIQRTVDNRGRAVAKETYALSTEDGATHYGGIVSWARVRGGLLLSLSDEAAAALSLSSEIELEMSEGDDLVRAERALEWLVNPSSLVPPDVFVHKP